MNIPIMEPTRQIPVSEVDFIQNSVDIAAIPELRPIIPRIYINSGLRRGLNPHMYKKLKSYLGDYNKLSSDETSAEEFSLWKLDKHQKLVLGVILASNFMIWMCLSLPPPLFPLEIANRHVDDMVIGWIFGVFSFVQFAMSPVYGKIIPAVGARFLFISGIFLGGGATILFGFMGDMPHTSDSRPFIVLCFIIRIVCSAGFTASFNTLFTIASLAFPDNVATVMGLTDAAVGVGLVVGQAVSGVLYEIGGFRLPFLVIGGLTVVTVPVYLCTLPSHQHTSVYQSSDTVSADSASSVLTLTALVKLPSASVTLLSLCLAAFSWVTLDPTLTPQLKKFNLRPGVLTVVFLLISASYSIFSPIIGHQSDKMRNTTPVIIIGYLVTALSMLLMGPSPLLRIGKSEIWLMLLALLMFGVGLSLTIVPTYTKILQASEDAGYKIGVETNGVIAGAWYSLYGIGETLGPVYGSSVTALIGFEYCTTYVSLMSFIMACVLTGLYIYERQKLSALNREASLEEDASISRRWSDPDLGKTDKEQIYNSEESEDDERTFLLGGWSI